MKVADVLQKTTQFLKDKMSESPRLDSEILLSTALGWQRIDLYIKHDYPLTEEELVKCREFVRRRSQGEPVAYIIGNKDFYGRTFHVGPQVLIPRPETEHVVEEVLKWTKARSSEQKYQILDMGSGSGALALTLALELPNSEVTAVEKSGEAGEIWKNNAEQLEAIATLHVQDVGEFFQKNSKQFDIVVANPPYIQINDERVQASVRKYEPGLALFAEDNGFQCIQKWSELVMPFLKEESLIVFEIGSDQGMMAAEHFTKLGLKNVKIEKDLAGLDRVVRGEL